MLLTIQPTGSLVPKAMHMHINVGILFYSLRTNTIENDLVSMSSFICNTFIQCCSKILPNLMAAM